MAKIARKETRTVRFFEVLNHDDMTPFSQHLPWDQALAGLTSSSLTAADRTVTISQEDHHGGGWMGTPTNMLLFSRIRADYDVPEVFDRAAGTLEALTLAETQGVAETTHVAFFPHNIVGMIRTTTSPGATSLATWINRLELLSGLPLVDISPLSRVSITSKVQDIDRARGVKIRARTTASRALNDGGARRLADTLDRLEEQFGPVTVEMRIYVTDDQPASDVRGSILDEAQGLIRLTAAGDAVEGLQAAELTYDSLEREKVESLNMMKDKFAERVEVEVIDGSGRSTRRESAAQAMQRAYDYLRDDLLAAVERDR